MGPRVRTLGQDSGNRADFIRPTRAKLSEDSTPKRAMLLSRIVPRRRTRLSCINSFREQLRGFSQSGIHAEGPSADLADDQVSLHCYGAFFLQILADQIEHGGESTEVVVFFNMEL